MVKEVEDPSKELKIKAEISYINTRLFSLIQELQKTKDVAKLKEGFEAVKVLDSNLDDIQQGCH